ncbi:3-oxoacyl-[acyl-carrier-protein] reductase FabG [compost metagenome]
MVRENPSELLQQWAKQTPLGRLGRPDECADAMIYLLSDASSFITGSEILIDGGLTV